MFIAIDHGTTSGYAVMTFKNDELVLKDYGFVRFEHDTTYDDIYSMYKEIFNQHDRDIQYVILEKINLSGTKFGGNNVLRLTEIRAMIKLIAHEKGMDIIEVNPKSMKKYVTDDGNAGKPEVASVICTMFDLNHKDIVGKSHTKKPEFDVTDAIALCYHGICTSDFTYNIKKYQVNKVRFKVNKKLSIKKVVV